MSTTTPSSGWAFAPSSAPSTGWQVVAEAGDGATAVAARRGALRGRRADGHADARDGWARCHPADRRRRTATKVMVLTTFEVDEYVFEAMRAGAAGFVLKRVPPTELIEAVRVVAAGESLLFPASTRAVIDGSPTGPAATARPDRARAGVLRLLARGAPTRRSGRGCTCPSRRSSPTSRHSDEARGSGPDPGGHRGIRVRVRDTGATVGSAPPTVPPATAWTRRAAYGTARPGPPGRRPRHRTDRVPTANDRDPRRLRGPSGPRRPEPGSTRSTCAASTSRPVLGVGPGAGEPTETQ